MDLIRLVDRIIEIVETEDFRLQEMGLAGFNYAKENFSKSNNLSKLKFELLN